MRDKSKIKMLEKMIEKKFNHKPITLEDLKIPRVSTGSISLDRITFGIPLGRVVEVFGPSASGKTTTSTLIAKSFAENFPDKFIGYIDMERALNVQHLVDYKVLDKIEDFDNRDVFLPQYPNTGEEALAITDMMIRTGSFSLVIIDSIPGLQRKAQYDQDIGDRSYASVAGLLTDSLPRLINSAWETGTTLLFINQVRDNMGASPAYGKSYTTPGGNSFKHACSLRLEVRNIESLYDKKTLVPYGHRVRYIIKKNKTGPNYGKIETSILYDRGYDLVDEIVDAAIDLEIIKSSGAWVYHGEDKYNGRTKFSEALRENIELQESLKVQIRDTLGIEFASREEVEEVFSSDNLEDIDSGLFESLTVVEDQENSEG